MDGRQPPARRRCQPHPQGGPEPDERLLHQLPQAQLLEQRGHRQESSAGGYIPTAEVTRRGSPDSVGLGNDVTSPLSGGLEAGMLLLIVERLGVS